MPIGKLDINLLSPAAKKLAKELDAAGYGMIGDRTKRKRYLWLNRLERVRVQRR